MNTTEDPHSKLWKANDAIARTLLPVMLYVLVLMLIGIVGNVIVCFVFYFRMLKTPQNVLIVVLAGFDLIMCFFTMPSGIVDMRYFLTFDSGVACSIIKFVSHYCAFSSVMIIIIIAVDRYRKICQPLKPQLTLSQAKLAVKLMMLFTLAFAVPVLFLYGKRSTKLHSIPIPVHDCNIRDRFKHTMFPLIYEIILYIAISLSFFNLSVCYLKIMRIIEFRMVRKRKKTPAIMMRKNPELLARINEAEESRKPVEAAEWKKKHIVHIMVDTSGVGVAAAEDGNIKPNAEETVVENDDANGVRSPEISERRTVTTNGKDGGVQNVGSFGETGSECRRKETPGDGEGTSDKGGMMLECGKEFVQETSEYRKDMLDNGTKTSQYGTSEKRQDMPGGREKASENEHGMQELGKDASKRGSETYGDNSGSSQVSVVSEYSPLSSSFHFADDEDETEEEDTSTPSCEKTAKHTGISIFMLGIVVRKFRRRTRTVGSATADSRQVNAKPERDSMDGRLSPIRRKTTTTRPPPKARKTSMFKAKRYQATAVAIMITVMLFISFTPYMIISTLRLIDSEYDRSLKGAALVFYNIFIRSYYISSVSNPIIYGVFNVSFRRECAVLFRKLLSRKNPVVRK